MMRTRHFRFHGVRIEVRAEAEPILDAIDSRLRLFRDEGPYAPDLVFEFLEGAAAAVGVRRPKGNGRPVYLLEGYEVTYHPEADQIYMARPGSFALVGDPARGFARCSLTDPSAQRVWLASHFIFGVPLIEMLKRRGLYAVHAAGVSVNGSAALFAGVSGSGKSTLALSLARAGLAFLGDDTMFLRHKADGVEVLAFPDEVDVRQGTARLLPELAHLADRSPEAGWPKHRIRLEDLYPINVAWTSTPGAVFFPMVGEARETRVSEIGRAEALKELVPNVPLTDVASSQAHLDALGALVRGSRCYRMTTGRDLDAIPALVRDILAAG